MFEVVWRTPAHKPFTWKYQDFVSKEKADEFALAVQRAADLLKVDCFVKTQQKNLNIKTYEVKNGSYQVVP
jgi:hypothetical protein